MRLKLNRALPSKVAVHVGVLFIGCAVVPLVGLAALTVRQTEAEVDTNARLRLHDDTKAVAMHGLERLNVLESALRVMGAAVLANQKQGWQEEFGELLGAPPAELAVFRPTGRPTRLRGDVTRPDLTTDQQDFLAGAGHLIVSGGSPNPSERVLLVRIVTPHGTAVVAASVDPANIFGVTAPEMLPANTGLCVFEPGGRTACTPAVPEAVMAAAAGAGARADLVAGDRGARYVVHTRLVPLQTLYDAAPWTIAMMRPQAILHASLQRFVRDFLLILLLALLCVAWLSITQVRRQLRPLVVLTDATRRMTRRDFSVPVELHSADEFEELGAAFNTLSDELRHQFADLEAFNQGALAALARTVDAKSAWTAGHSERVTEMAVRIGRAMGLPEDDIVALQRGGLVHDIGKLAVPTEILDKPGALTPEEFSLVRQHPAQGVHILEPVPAFRRLLPIVGQHHERWDGKGYPQGLSGERIAITARVLAVADVYDALRSDRPYRDGLPLDDVTARIAAGAGTQFDPAAVRAFLALVNQELVDDLRQPA